jgi:hypothetical protein
MSHFYRRKNIEVGEIKFLQLLLEDICTVEDIVSIDDFLCYENRVSVFH